MELLLFGSGLFFWLAILAVFLFAIVGENQKHGGWGFVGLVAFVIVLCVSGNKSGVDIVSLVKLNWLLLAKYAGIFLAVGAVFAAIRSYWEGTDYREEYKKLIADGNDDEAEDLVSRQLSYLKGNVIRWWTSWPASLPYWILVDVLGEFFSKAYDKCRRIFEAAFRAGLK